MFDEAVLDDAGALALRDSRDTLRALATAGAQVRRAVVAAGEAGVDRFGPNDRPRAVLVAALGDSAVVGEVLDLLAEPGSPVPVLSRRGGPLPAWVGPMDLVVAVSQSGRAGGPVDLVAEAGRRGAQLVTVGADDSPLADACARGRGLHVPLPYAAPSSRTALWSLLTPVLVAADRLGLLRAEPEVFAATADRLDACAEECRAVSEAFVNPAKVLATGLAGAVPVVLGDGALAGVAAVRTAAMLARTARVPATCGVLPDAAAQIVATFDGPFAAGRGADPFADPYLEPSPGAGLALVLLRAAGVRDTRSAQLADAVAASAQNAGVAVHEVAAEGDSPLERWASLVARTDFAASYLALACGLDPSISAHVTDLRDRTD